MGISAVNTGNNLIYLTASALLALMGISGFFGKANISRLAVSVEFPDEIYAGVPFPLRIRVRNNRRVLPAFLILVRVADRDVLFPFIDKQSEVTRRIDLSFPVRGDRVIRNVGAGSVFPFNFFVRFTGRREDFHAIVFPRLTRGGVSSADGSRRDGGEGTFSQVRGYESDMISIRDYVPGDPFKYINWKATAKTGDLKAKELSSPALRPVTIDFDQVDIQDREEKISRIAYTVSALVRANVPVGLKLGGVLHKPGTSRAHRAGMLKALALYPPVDHPFADGGLRYEQAG